MSYTGTQGNASATANDAGTTGASGTSGPTGDEGGMTTGDPGDMAHGSVAVISQIFTADEPVSYIIHTPALAGGVNLRLDTAIEVPGRALGSGPGALSLFVGSNTGAMLQHYRVDASGALQAGRAVSFINQGVSSIGEYQGQFQYGPGGASYFFHGDTGQVIAWNREQMTVGGATPIPDAVQPGEITTFAPDPVVIGTTAYVPIGWRTHDNLSVPSRAAMLMVDTASGAQSFASDLRCGYVRDGVLGPDGHIYLVTEAYASAVHRIAPESAPEPCMLRFNTQTQTFDPSFHLKLSDLVGGATAGSLIVGGDGQAYLRVLDESLTEVTPETHPRVLASVPAWTWWALKLGSQVTATKVEGMPATGGSTLVFHAGGRRLYPSFSADYATTAFMGLESSELGSFVATAPGLVFSVVDL